MESTTIRASFPSVFDLGRAAGFDLGFRQLDSGPEGVQAELRVGDQLALVRMTFDRAYHQCGLPPGGMKSFGVPLRPMRNWFGNEYKESSILPFNIPGGIDGVSESGFEAYTVSVRDDSIQSISEGFHVPVSDILIAPRSNTVIGPGRMSQLVRHLISKGLDDGDQRFDTEFEAQAILALLHAALGEPAYVDKSSPASRSRAVSRAIAFIESHRDEAVSVAEICQSTGIPLRTLNRAFREHFGVGPKAYLIRQRLSDARRELVRAPSGTVIADVANRWGFWHMGQFARDYKTVFGELPSQTLARDRIHSR
jgi:AraC-like DNA-binding protein